MFGKEDIEVEDCECAFRDIFVAKDEHILVLYDTVYSHCIGKRVYTIMNVECIPPHLSNFSQTLTNLGAHDYKAPFNGRMIS